MITRPVFFSKNVGNVLQYTASGFPDNGTEYVWGVWSGNSNGWCPKPGVSANARIFTNGVPYGASVVPKYWQSGNRAYFQVTAYSKEPVHLEIWNPNDSLLKRFYVPPMVEQKEYKKNINLPPAPSGGTYRFRMYSDVTGDLVWQGQQKFTGPKFRISTLSLNPHWVPRVGWDLQYLTMKLKNVGDMPIILYGLKLRLEKSSFSTEEITLNRSGDANAEYGWTIEEGLKWGLVPGETAIVAPWGSKKQFLFGQFLDPGEYRLYITLSDQLNILPVPELAFEFPP